LANPADCRTDSTDWDEPTYRLLVSNQFTDDAYGYLSFAHGFKSGGYSDQAGSAFPNVPLSVTRYDPEEADSLEIGLKLDFWEDRARLNTAVFYVEYTDMQRAAIATVPPLQETLIFNAADVPAYGFELEGSFLFTDKWSGRFNVGYLNAKYDKFELDLTLDGTIDQDLSGRDVSRAPEWQLGADLTYDTQLGNIGSLRAQASVYYQAENTFYYAAEPLQPDGGEQFDTVIESYTLLGAFLTYTHSSDKWYASIYGKNLTDERYISASQYVGGLWTFSTYAPPRTYGIEFGISL
jgi:iron complex outermembrane receptor protein